MGCQDSSARLTTSQIVGSPMTTANCAAQRESFVSDPTGRPARLGQ